MFGLGAYVCFSWVTFSRLGRIRVKPSFEIGLVILWYTLKLGDFRIFQANPV